MSSFSNQQGYRPDGRAVEREFFEDLRLLLQDRQIKDLQKNRSLDSRGVDALVTRNDGKSVKINVMVDSNRALRLHEKVNKRNYRDPMRRNILLWRHKTDIDRPTRMQALLRAIEEHNPDAQ